MSSLDHLRESWAALRPVYLSQGLDDLVYEADTLCADEHKLLHAPATFEREWNEVRSRLKDASMRRLDEDGGLAAAPVYEWLEYVKQSKDERLARIAAKLRTPRGIMYIGFLLIAQGRTKDWYLASVMPMRPDLTAALGTEIHDGIEGQLVEQRVRQLAGATMRVVETFYKPLISIVWTLTARMAGHTGTMPRMCGQIMRSCRDLWGTRSDFLEPTDFLDWEALQVRNGIAHPAKTRFDVDTQELVFEEDDGTDRRFTEKELRRRLHAVLYRCVTMDSALLWVSCNLPREVLAPPKALTPEALAVVEAVQAPTSLPGAGSSHPK